MRAASVLTGAAIFILLNREEHVTLRKASVCLALAILMIERKTYCPYCTAYCFFIISSCILYTKQIGARLLRRDDQLNKGESYDT